MTENRMKEFAELLGLELDEEFKLCGIADKYKLTINGIMRYSPYGKEWLYDNLPAQVLTGKFEIIKLPKPILDDSEKEYLLAVIKPFKNRVISIRKIEDPGEECLLIYVEHFRDKSNGETFTLPSFEKKTMYNGMELGKRYTLEELGL